MRCLFSAMECGREEMGTLTLSISTNVHAPSLNALRIEHYKTVATTDVIVNGCFRTIHTVAFHSKPPHTIDSYYSSWRQVRKSHQHLLPLSFSGIFVRRLEVISYGNRAQIGERRSGWSDQDRPAPRENWLPAQLGRNVREVPGYDIKLEGSEQQTKKGFMMVLQFFV